MTFTLAMCETYLTSGGTPEGCGAPANCTAPDVLLAWLLGATLAQQEYAWTWMQNWVTAHGGSNPGN